jgi:hypothetical protein
MLNRRTLHNRSTRDMRHRSLVADTVTTILMIALVVALVVTGLWLSGTEDYAADCARRMYRDPVTGRLALLGRMPETSKENLAAYDPCGIVAS